MSTWPATLPAPRATDYRLAPAAQTARTEMEVGAARVRRRSAARVDSVALEWLMDDAQFAQFRAWHESPTGAAAGAAWFTGLAVAGVAAGVRSTDSVRFAGEWAAERVSNAAGPRWRVSATLEVR